MTKKFSIAVDAMGGDNAPEKVLEGINLLFKNKVDVHVDIYGDKDLILKSVNNYKYLNKNNCTISHSPDKVPGDISVRDAIKIGNKLVCGWQLTLLKLEKMILSFHQEIQGHY